jgi:hypothetical protein
MYTLLLSQHRRALLATGLACMVMAGCQRQPDAPATVEPAAQAPVSGEAAAPSQPGELKDVIENTPAYVVGITYPQGIAGRPGLAQALAAYAASARADLKEAVDALGNDKPSAPYELSLSFEKILDTPRLVAVAADGSLYTGGAHGMPLMARFVWLPEQERMLTAKELVPSGEGWKAVSDYAAKQLRHAAQARAEADHLDPDERQDLLEGASKMIAEGTTPDPDNFAQFEPIVDGTGRITAVRFVFPPYQVGPYSDGTQSVDVPASVLLPHVAPAYRDLFAH